MEKMPQRGSYAKQYFKDVPMQVGALLLLVVPCTPLFFRYPCCYDSHAYSCPLAMWGKKLLVRLCPEENDVGASTGRF